MLRAPASKKGIETSQNSREGSLNERDVDYMGSPGQHLWGKRRFSVERHQS